VDSLGKREDIRDIVYVSPGEVRRRKIRYMGNDTAYTDKVNKRSKKIDI